MFHKEQTIQQLCEEFTKRVAPSHKYPSTVTISQEEMAALYKAFPVCILLESARRTASVVKKEPALTLDKVIHAFRNLAARQLREAKDKGKYLNFLGAAALPTPKPKVSKADRTAAIQVIFHERVGSLHPDSYTLYPAEAERLLDLPSERLREILEKTKVWLEGEQGERTVDPQEISDYLFWEAQEHLQVVQR